jgi:hypothetical protein
MPVHDRRQFVNDMIAFAEMQEKTWDGIASSLEESRQSLSSQLSGTSALNVPVGRARRGGAPRAALEAFFGPDVRRRLMAVAQVFLVLLVANAPRPLWIASGIYAVLVVLGVPDAMRAAAVQGGRGTDLDEVLGRMTMKRKVEKRINEYRRKLTSGEVITDKEMEQMDKDEEFLNKTRNNIPRIYKTIYQTVVMFILSALPGARYEEALLN